MPYQTLRDALEVSVKNLYGAEKQLLKVLPRMAKAANSLRLRGALEELVHVTVRQVERLEQVFSQLDLPFRKKRCAGMEGLIDEGREILAECDASTPEVVDAALIMAACNVEHYQMSAYGSSRSFAEALGLHEIARLLQLTLDEESDANGTLTAIADEVVNTAAARYGRNYTYRDEADEGAEEVEDSEEDADQTA